MEIKSLPQDVRDILRSGENINTISQCVMELVLNSLDAKATAIAVRINLLTLRIQVVDNGVGVTKSNMKCIGVRYMTSKCHSLSDLKKTKKFGFRGEALASICQMAKKVDIVSRSEGTESTYSKTYENGKWSLLEIIKTRPGTGTTVTITEFMHKLPVRQKRIRKNLDLDETKRRIEELAIIHCKVSFSLRNDATGKIILQSKLIENVSQSLNSFYPHIKIGELVQIKVSKGKICATGLIYKLSSKNSKLQFIYLNKRPIICTKIQKFINGLLSKIILKGEHPVYCLNIRCPYSSVDLIMSPSKTTVEFKNWEIVRKCLEKAVKVVVQDSNLVPKMNSKHMSTHEKAPSYKSQFGLSLITGAVKGNKVKRKSGIELNCALTHFVESTDGICLKKIKNGHKKRIEKRSLYTAGVEQSKYLANHTMTTNNIENQEKGKELIMNRFLKSAVTYPTGRSHTVTDDIKTIVVEKTTKNKFANTTMTMTFVSKQTVLKNGRLGRCEKNMISKCVQTTMVEQRKDLVDFVSDSINPRINIAKSQKKRSEFNCKPKSVALFGSFGKSFVPNFGRPESFFRPIPSFFQNTNFTSFDIIKDCFPFSGNRRNNLNFFNPLPLYRPQLPNFAQVFNNNDCGPLLPRKWNFNRPEMFNTELARSIIWSPYFTKNVTQNSLNHLEYKIKNFASVKNFEISPYFKRPMKEMPNSGCCYKRELRKPKHFLKDCEPKIVPINPFSNRIGQNITNKRTFSNVFDQNQRFVSNNFLPNFTHGIFQPNAKRKRLQEKTYRKIDSSAVKCKIKRKSQLKNRVKLRDLMQSNTYQEKQNREFDPKPIKKVHKSNTNGAYHVFHNKIETVQPVKKPKLNFLQEIRRQKSNFNFIPNFAQPIRLSDNPLFQEGSEAIAQSSTFCFTYDVQPVSKESLFKSDTHKKDFTTDPSTSIRFRSSSSETFNPKCSSLQIKYTSSNENKMNEKLPFLEMPILNQQISQKPNANFPTSYCNVQPSAKECFSNEKLFCQRINEPLSSNVNLPTFRLPNCTVNDQHLNFWTDHNDKNFSNLVENQTCSGTLKNTKIPKSSFKKHSSHSHTRKSKLSLKRCDSFPMSKPDVHYDDFKPDLCSTRNHENLFYKHSNFPPTKFPNSTLSEKKELSGKTPEWLRKEDKLGNKFYLNARTGMTSIFRPKEVDKFNIGKRIDFVPKGLSPIMVEIKKIDVSMSPKSKKELHDFLIESYKSELETVKWSNLIDNTDIKHFFRKLYEVKTKLFENCIPNASINTKCMVKQCNNAQAQAYSKDLLLNLDVIGQWDHKFIVTLSKTKQTLFLFDQHAVSERIRLEKLLKDYKEEEKFKSVRCDMRIYKTFSESDLKILAEFNNIFENLGIYYTVRANVVYISRVPICFYAKLHNNELDQLKNLVISVICEQLQVIKATRGVGSKMPQVLQNTVNSEACRGAIKFGDYLSTTDCEELVKELHNCQLPFQCAHGRPSFVPIINLERSFLLERCKPDLRKLKN